MPSSVKVFFNNSGALFLIQISNYLFPLLLIPYLTRVLGVSMYGLIAFGLAIVQIACVVTDYGFGLSATYQIAKQQSDKIALRKIISAVMVCKIGLLIPVAAVLALFILYQEKYAEYQIFLWWLLLPIIGQTFQPIWFFQGIERMTFITLFTVASRALYLVLVICWVSSQSDYYWVAIANGISAIAASIIGLGVMLKLGYWPRWCGWEFVKRIFRDSTEFFWSRAAVATYTAGGAFFLGLVSTPTQVAYYSAAEQLYKGAQSLFTPISQALYPHMAKHHNFPLFFNILRGGVVLGVIGLVVGSLIGEWALELIFGSYFSMAYPVLLVFMITFLITTPSILLGYPFLGALGNPKAANISVMWAGLVQVGLLTMCYFAGFYQAAHIAITVLLVEVVVLLYRAHHAKKIYQLALVSSRQ